MTRTRTSGPGVALRSSGPPSVPSPLSRQKGGLCSASNRWYISFLNWPNPKTTPRSFLTREVGPSTCLSCAYCAWPWTSQLHLRLEFGWLLFKTLNKNRLMARALGQRHKLFLQEISLCRTSLDWSLLQCPDLLGNTISINYSNTSSVGVV